MRLWDVETGQQVCTLKPGSQYVDCVAFSPDGQRIATGNWNATVNIVEALAPQSAKIKSARWSLHLYNDAEHHRWFRS